MTKYMSKKRFIILCVTLILDVVVASYAIAFSEAQVAIRGVVLMIMLAAMAYEVFDATKEYRASKKKAAHNARRHKVAA